MAPASQRSADGRTARAGALVLSVGQVAELEPAGQAVQVSGSGYDVTKGVYVALCVVPAPNAVPAPCGGGVDLEGQAGAAHWISSNPPSYGAGLATPYGPGGSFTTSFAVRAEIAPGVDCRILRCALLTRNDHTRGGDRSQDLMVPVSFRSTTPVIQVPGGAPGPLAPSGPTTLPLPVTPSTTVAVPAPAAEDAVATTTDSALPRRVVLAADGRSVSDGTRSVAVSDVRDLEPSGGTVTVRGSGFQSDRGVYVSLCRQSEDPLVGPGPCAGGPGASVWLHSSPPHGQGVSVPFGPDGSFDVALSLDAVIDDSTDCTVVACAVVVRSDDSDERSLDIAVPVVFRSHDRAVADLDGRGAAARPTSTPSSDTASVGLPAGASVLLVALAGSVVVGGALVLRRRRVAK